MNMPNTNKIKKPENPAVGAIAKPISKSDSSNVKIDVDTTKKFVNDVIDSSLSSTLDIGALEAFTTIANNRDQVYQQIDTMANDSAVSAVIKTFAGDVCEMNDNGHIVWAESNNANISKYINYLLNITNVDKNVYKWTTSLIKYGDVYLRLYRNSDYKDDHIFNKNGIEVANRANRTTLNEDKKQDDKNLKENVLLNIHHANDNYSYYAEMVPDPSTMFELTKYGKVYGYIETPNIDLTNGSSAMYSSLSPMGTTSNQQFNFMYKSGDVVIYQADDFVHACLDDDLSRYPETVELFESDDDMKNNMHGNSYQVHRGKSLLYDNYKTWREMSLLEAAILLNRVTRSSVVRLVAVEVGDMPKEQVSATLRRIKEMMEQKSAINVGNSMNEYTNPSAVENNIYYTTHGGQGAISVSNVGGDSDVNSKGLGDLDWWASKFYSGFGIPKQYFGMTEDSTGFNGGTSLTIISSEYAKSVKRIQNTMAQAITDMINLYLIDRGFLSYLNNFTIKFRAPLTQEELNYRENISNRINGISSMMSLFTDVEDKSRRLRILKDLVSTLNYNDDILMQIQKEIDAADAAKARAEAESENSSENESEGKTAGEEQQSAELTPSSEVASTENAEDIDLGSSAEAPTQESFTDYNKNKKLNEENFDPSLKWLYENEDDLPTPNEADSDIDFTDNTLTEQSKKGNK